MATTTNAAIVYPVVGNTITPLATHFANLANSVDAMYVTLRDGNARLIGTNAARTALSGALLREGVEFYTQDTDLGWFYNGTAWRLTPGQLIASGSWTADGAAPANFAIGVITTPTLNAGQNLLIVPNFGTAYAGSTTYTNHTIRVLVGGTVTATTGAVHVAGRAEITGGGFTISIPSQSKVYNMASGGTLSLGMYVATAVSLYGADGQSLAVFSA